MNREIKFRAWNKKEKTMLLPGTLSFQVAMLYPEGNCIGIPFHIVNGDDVPDEYTLLQFTGLKDKNGKDIYEGDHFGDPHFPVVFDRGCFCLGGVPLVDYLDGKTIEGVTVVVGNIYENTDLLK